MPMVQSLCNGDSFYAFDTTKLSIHTRNTGLAGIEVYDLLRDEYDIQIEFGDIGNILAIVTAGDRELEIERLISALSEIKRLYGGDPTGMLNSEYIPPDVALPPQQAFFAEKEAVPLRFSIGRVCAEFVMCYPPGIPILAPGERITEAIVSYILYAKGKGLFADRFTGYDPVQLTGSSIRKGETKQYDGYLVYGKSHRPCADVHAGG